MVSIMPPTPLLQSSTILLLTAGVIFLCHKIVATWRIAKSLNFHPGPRTFLSPNSVLGNFVLPEIPWITTGRNFLFVNKYKKFEQYGWDIYSMISLWPTLSALLIVADAAAIKEVTSSRARFPKPVELYGTLTFFGRNIVASEGEEWKKYRKISAPAFSDKNNKLVWDETVRIVNDLFSDVWAGQDSITLDHCVEITLPIALFVIGAAGFGNRMSWKEDASRGPGHQLTFKEALHNVSTGVFIKIAVPKWAMGLTARTRSVRLSFDELERYMAEMIQERLNSEKVERYDLFSSLLDSNNQDSSSSALTESELVGNVFIFLLAGHETTAHTLCFTFALLALYQDEQELLYQHIKSVLTDDRIPTYDDMTLLTRSSAVFNETLRLFPPVTNIPKRSAEDTTLVASNSRGETVTIPVPKGTPIAIDTAGLHYNPRYWDDPYAFKPERFLKDYPRDAFLPFSAGVRSCIGRKFFETEGVAVLTIFISRYKITVKEESKFANETFEERKERVLNSRAGITVTPIRVPLVFTKRNEV